MSGRGRELGAACALAALAIDQASKALAVSFSPNLAGGIEVLPVLNLVFLRNPGVSFGLFGSVPWWALTVLGLAIVAVLTLWLATVQSRLVAARQAMRGGER